MDIVAFIAAVVAVVLFTVAWARDRSLVPAGLALLTAAWIVQQVWVTHAHQIHLG